MSEDAAEVGFRRKEALLAAWEDTRLEPGDALGSLIGAIVTAIVTFGAWNSVPWAAILLGGVSGAAIAYSVRFVRRWWVERSSLEERELHRLRKSLAACEATVQGLRVERDQLRIKLRDRKARRLRGLVSSRLLSVSEGMEKLAKEGPVRIVESRYGETIAAGVLELVGVACGRARQRALEAELSGRDNAAFLNVARSRIAALALDLANGKTSLSHKGRAGLKCPQVIKKQINEWRNLLEEGRQRLLNGAEWLALVRERALELRALALVFDFDAAKKLSVVISILGAGRSWTNQQGRDLLDQLDRIADEILQREHDVL